MLRTQLHADPAGVFLHDAVLKACHRFASRIAIVDTSCSSSRRISYSEFGTLIETVARGLVAIGIHPGDVVAIYLANGWEYAVAFQAIMLSGAIPTLLNPSYREREVRYQLQDSGAVMLLTDGPLVSGIDLAELPALRLVFTTRHASGGSRHFAELLKFTSAKLPKPSASCEITIAALPYSSGTTGLPKGVMLTHSNLLTNCYQLLAPGEQATPTAADIALTFLPLYHIYGLNVLLNPLLLVGATNVLMPRFDLQKTLSLLTSENITFLPLVPPVLNALSNAAEQGLFPAQHSIRSVKCGAAPLAPDLPKRFTSLTGAKVRQGYGMTEASPVTHLGYLEPHLYHPETIGKPVAMTDCRLVDEKGFDVPTGQPGELVMRGPQFSPGYWHSPEATAEVFREGWYWSGDIATRDEDGFYKIVDRRKEMIKYKGFPIAPAEVEAVLLEHPAVQDCGVIGVPDEAAGEMPCAFIVLHSDTGPSGHLENELCGFVAQRLTAYKQPRSVRFVQSIPRNPSGKILRKDLRALL